MHLVCLVYSLSTTPQMQVHMRARMCASALFRTHFLHTTHTLNTVLWYVSVCTAMPPVLSTMPFISAMPTCGHQGAGMLGPCCAGMVHLEHVHQSH